MLTLYFMAGFNRCRTGEAEHKKARALKLRAEDPNLTARELSERLAVPFNTMRVWLKGAGEERTEDARGMVHRREAQARRDGLDSHGFPGFALTRAELDNLDAFAAGEMDDGGVTARPRNMALADLCPESL